jgi:hypothetical protein
MDGERALIYSTRPVYCRVLEGTSIPALEAARFSSTMPHGPAHERMDLLGEIRFSSTMPRRPARERMDLLCEIKAVRGDSFDKEQTGRPGGSLLQAFKPDVKPDESSRRSGGNGTVGRAVGGCHCLRPRMPVKLRLRQLSLPPVWKLPQRDWRTRSIIRKAILMPYPLRCLWLQGAIP